MKLMKKSNQAFDAIAAYKKRKENSLVYLN